MLTKYKLKESELKNRDPRFLAAVSLLTWLQTNQITYHQRSYFKINSDFGLYKHIASNVVRHRKRLEYIIELLTRRSLQKIDPEAQVCLFMGLIQLDKDSRVETYAAINESVELIKTLKKPHLKGFINANLRRFLREREEVEDVLKAQPLYVSTSHTKQQIERWTGFYGLGTTTSICKSNNVLPEVQIVLNPVFERETIINDLQSDGFDLFDHHEDGFSVKNPEGFFDSEWAKKGAFLVQDHAFQQINHLMKNLPKGKVLDACAAPGGKSIHLEWQSGGDLSLLVSSELNDLRMKTLKENMASYQSKAKIIQSDAFYPPFNKSFDLVICDAPCSGTGTIRKHPEIKWSRSEKDYLRNQKIQLNLLKQLAETIKSKGHLLYVTCSLERDENQDVAEKFLEYSKKTFQLVPLDHLALEESTITKRGYFQTLTSAKQVGAFSALFRKR